MPDNRETEHPEIAKVIVADDRLQAFLVVNEPTEGPEEITTEKVLHIIEEAGLDGGPRVQLVEHLLQRKEWGQPVEIARGVPAQAGADAKLDFQFPIQHSLKPKLQEDGHVDYREVNLIHSVDKDAVLVRKIPAQQGNPGKDIFGNEIPAMAGEDVAIAPGDGTYCDPGDDMVLRAACDGVVFYSPTRQSLEVQELYLVKDCVDYSTGNIHVKSSVEVRRDVKPGFSIATPYDVEIKGVVEHAEITCDGSLIVHAGISGDGKHKIAAGGDVHTSYIYNQPLKANSSLYVKSEIRGCDIACGDEVVVENSNSIIIGGHVSATNRISSSNIGNENHIHTVVEAGVRSKFKDEYLGAKAKMAALSEQMDVLREQTAFIVKKYPEVLQGARLEPLRKSWKQYKAQFNDLTRKIETLKKAYYDAVSPEICVRGTIYPGTIVRIKEAEFEVKSMLTRVRFGLVGKQIDYKPLK